MELINSLNWRYATKKFDPTKKVSEEDLALIKEAIRLSASSYGLQLYKVLVIEDAEIRERLKPASWGQSQITDASHLFVFCNYAEVRDDHIDEYLNLKADTQGLEVESLVDYGNMMKGSMSGLSDAQKAQWTAKQTYIALGNLLAVCSLMRIDACPMEGFEPAKYNDILGLTEKGLNASVIATVGYRSEEDKTQFLKKVRKAESSLFESI